MVTPRALVDLPFRDLHGAVIGLVSIFAPRAMEGALIEVSIDECARFGEESIQLLESVRYEYAISIPAVTLRTSVGVGVVKCSLNPNLSNTGSLDPGVRTGRLALELVDAGGVVLGCAAVEVRSRKLNYRTDLRQMLSDITARAVELAFEIKSPTTLMVRPDPSNRPETLHQQFCFLKGLLDGGAFDAALHLIAGRPNERLVQVGNMCQVSRGVRANRGVQKAISKGGRRVILPEAHPLSLSIKSLPASIPAIQSQRSVDTQENRVIRFVLVQFIEFVAQVKAAAEGVKSADLDRLRVEATEMGKWLQSYLNHPFLAGVSELDRVPMESPVLQRQSGYREVMSAWLRFDMAARLTWDGVDDVYAAGQQDVATLYEYWVFFELLAIVGARCDIKNGLADRLIEISDDKLNLRLRTGKNVAITGVALVSGVYLNVQFDYNRTFVRRDRVGDVGTWTQRMRPDYTITIWPADLREKDAAESGSLIHVHFDAKYRVDTLESLFSADDSGLSEDDLNLLGVEESRAEVAGTYKRGDLLKMHAYRDAIRRSVGAYVLYPGSNSIRWTGYHELLPGLGAFVLKPGSGSSELADFLNNVLLHAASNSIRQNLAVDAAHSYAGSKGSVVKGQL